MNNAWDTFISVFGSVKNESDITPTNADNILIAWPVILDCINRFGPPAKNTHLLEYGCGTGSLAYNLSQLGYEVTGSDSSEKMIQTAKSEFKNIHFLVGDSSALSGQNQFSVVTSVMTFQFIENIEGTFHDIANVLKQGGIFVFAVFNPAFVKECLRGQIFFENFDSFEKPTIGKFSYDGSKIPVFIRTAEDYNKMLQKLGFESLLQSYPVFTEQFHRKYPISNLVNESEYLILGYKKI